MPQLYEMTIRWPLLAAGAVLILGGGVFAGVAVASGTSQDVTCTITDSTLTCPLPQATPVTSTVTETATSTATETTTTTVTETAPPVTTTVTASPVTSTQTVTSTTTVTASPTSSTTTAAPTPSTTTTTTTPPATAWPDASNTGAKGTLAKQSGDLTITTAGTTLQNVDIAGTVTVRADNVTLKNVKVSSGGFWVVYNYGKNLTVTDATLTGTADTQASLAGDNITATRVNISGAGDGAKLGSNSSLVDSYIHDLGGAAQGAHNDGIELTGAVNSKVTHNTILNSNGQTSAIMLSEYYGTGNANVLVQNNLLGGGGFTLYGGYESGKTLKTGLSVKDNQFTTRFFATSGYYGPVAYWDSRNTWSGNTWADGPKAGQQIPAP
jgi:hypothetical protein